MCIRDSRRSFTIFYVQRFIQISLSKFEEEWENGKKNIVKAHRIKGVWYEKEFTGAIKYSETTKRKQLHEWETKKAVSLEKIEEVRAKLNRKGKGRKITAKGLMNLVVDTVPKQYRGLFDYNVIETCLLYTSDAADEEDSVDLGGR